MNRTGPTWISKAIGWSLSIVGGVVVTIAVEGGLISGWTGAIAAGLGTLSVSIGVNMVAFDIRHARGQD